jgi:hypothetical protein
MEIPTAEDWQFEEQPPDLDEAWAYKNFYGKTFEEAVRLFEENAFHYQEDLYYMPGRVFGFYLKAFIAYLMSDAARGECDAASSFIHLIRSKAKNRRDDIIPLWPEIEPALRRLAEHQADYGADREVYGSFRKRVGEIARQVS